MNERVEGHSNFFWVMFAAAAIGIGADPFAAVSVRAAGGSWGQAGRSPLEHFGWAELGLVVLPLALATPIAAWRTRFRGLRCSAR